MEAQAEGSQGKSLSQLFDETYQIFTNIVNSANASSSKELQDKIAKTIKNLEELTRGISMADVFSKNENYKEMDPNEMKFLLLPYMLGSLWQVNTKEERRHICEISEIYFKDFLKRCKDYEFIESSDDEVENVEGETPKPKHLSPADKRDKKIRRMKQTIELDAKIDGYRKWVASTKEPDSETTKLLYISLIKRSINDVEDQLDSIAAEMELIEYAEKAEDRKSGTGQVQHQPRPSQPLKPFIITKDATQKKVFGMGYPSLPVMTVEELYEQRRATGEWGPPPQSGTIPNPEDTGEEAEAVLKDALEDQDDEATIERQRQFDEYKDDHRRGWGNRFNRS